MKTYAATAALIALASPTMGGSTSPQFNLPPCAFVPFATTPQPSNLPPHKQMQNKIRNVI